MNENDNIAEKENNDGKIADLIRKNKEANEFILEIAKMLNIETDGIGFDELPLSLDDFREAIHKHRLGDFYKLTCENQYGDYENNGYYTTKEAVEKAKSTIDQWPVNIRYGIKQTIEECGFSD